METNRVLDDADNTESRQCCTCTTYFAEYPVLKNTPEPDWRRLALHALSDLRTVGIPIEKIIGMTPEVLALVDEYDRETQSFT